MTSLPTWAVWVLSFGSPAVTAVITLLGHWFSRSASKELDQRSKHEEVMRNLRWAAELAVSDDVGQARLGIEQLQVLSDSGLLSLSEETYVDAALRAAIEGPRQAIIQAGGDVEVMVADNSTGEENKSVPSEEESTREETDA